jgi:hypothetical protein
MRPDAIFLPESVKPGGKIGARVVAVSKIAEALLEADYDGGERVYIRKQPHGRLFVTRDPLDTINFPTGHDRSGSPRYRWERREGRVELGFLLEQPCESRSPTN